MPVLDPGGILRVTMRWRWQEDGEPGTPEGNMAADTLLLQEVREGAVPVVRIYTWDRPSVSLGRLQNEEAVRAAHPGLPLVRRPTGGRAVLHGDDLCITVAARLADLPLGDGGGVLASYRLLAGSLVDAFQALDIAAEFGRAGSASAGPSSVDCFAAAARCDIVDGRTGRKLAGCAQRREGPALLQQMSIPSATLSIPEFVARVRRSLAATLCIVEWARK